MRFVKVLTIVAIIALSFSLAFASGDAGKGKKLFNDAGFGGSPNSKSCNTCHADGARLEQAGTKKYTALMGMEVSSLEEVVNICIERPLKGKAIAKDSQQMKDMIAYIKSLGKHPGGATPGYPRGTSPGYPRGATPGYKSPGSK